MTRQITLTPAFAHALLEAMQPVLDGEAEAMQITLTDDHDEEIEVILRSDRHGGATR